MTTTEEAEGTFGKAEGILFFVGLPTRGGPLILPILRTQFGLVRRSPRFRLRTRVDACRSSV